MANGTLKRPAFGWVAELGTLYDARTDNFLEQSLLLKEPPDDAMTVEYHDRMQCQSFCGETLSDRFRHLGIDHDLQASILAELTRSAGASEHVYCQHDNVNAVQGSFYRTISVFHENLDFTKRGLTGMIHLEKDVALSATHVVAGIEWGAQTVVCAKHSLRQGEDREAVQRELRYCLDRLQHATTPGDFVQNENFAITMYTDLEQPQSPMPGTFAGAFAFLQQQISLLETDTPAPLNYVLLPLSVLATMGLVQNHTATVVAQPSFSCVERLSKAMEHLQSRPAAESYLNYIKRYRFCVPAKHIRDVEQYIREVKSVEASFKDDSTNVLQRLRHGVYDHSQMEQLLQTLEHGNASPQKSQELLHAYVSKIYFVNMVTSQGGRYIDDAGPALDRKLKTLQCKDIYVMFFNRQAMKDGRSWPPHMALLTELLKDSQNSHSVLIVDNVTRHHGGGPLNHAYIAQYRNSILVNEDVLALRNFTRTQCLSKYDPKKLERTMKEKPVQRRPVKITCPGLKCSKKAHEWICSICHTSVEFGYTDKFIYCDCGACHFMHWEFRCNDSRHGPSYERHNSQNLLQTLKTRKTFEEINILILGETGVGKSTFINAFINYLTFPSLQEALRNDNLVHVIPCSFSTQYQDPTDRTGRFVQKDIKIGSDDVEADESVGQSATQRTTVHAILMGSIMIRLIDTPGIGDVRGAEQDKRNMADILSVLRGYERLHCILMLLKPNNARLNVTFRFCVKELLTHLHRDAAHNMVFGFTNTRGSNYTPGDTFKPLEHLLSQHKDSNLGLSEKNVYCFDSEAFRYMAAKKKGVDLGRLEDYSRSWLQSENESHRLLDHIKTLAPHEFKNTMSLNETRALIAQLTKPMAEIAQQIKASIAISEDEIRELKTTRMSRRELEDKLHVQKKILKAHQLDRPRTVCAHRDCIDFQNDGQEGILKTIYKTTCHKPCSLQNVPVETVRTPELGHCWAFSGKETCRGCKHHWTEHLHVLFELREETTTVKDEAIDETIRNHTDNIALREAAIGKRAKAIKEFALEHRAIQTATARFSLYLKENSITPYNDATIEYLDHLIKKELEKVQAGGPLKRLKELETYKAQYAQLVEVFTTNLQAGKGEMILDTACVEVEVQKLYSLKHYGQNLRRLRQIVETSHAATFREKPYQVKQKKWTPLNFLTGYWDNDTNALPIRSAPTRQTSIVPALRVETRTHYIPQRASLEKSRSKMQGMERVTSPLFPQRPQPVSSPWQTSAELEGNSYVTHPAAKGLIKSSIFSSNSSAPKSSPMTSSSIAEFFLHMPKTDLDQSSNQALIGNRIDQGFNTALAGCSPGSPGDINGTPQSPYAWLDPIFAEPPIWKSPHPSLGMRHRTNTGTFSVPEHDNVDRRRLDQQQCQLLDDLFRDLSRRQRHSIGNTSTFGNVKTPWDGAITTGSRLNRAHSLASTSTPPPRYETLSRSNTARLSMHDRVANDDKSPLPDNVANRMPELAENTRLSIRQRLVPNSGFWTRRR